MEPTWRKDRSLELYLKCDRESACSIFLKFNTAGFLPTVLDDEYESGEVSEDEEDDELTYNSEVNDFGEQLTGDIEGDIDVLLILEVHSARVANDREVKTQKPKLEALKPNFGFFHGGNIDYFKN
jgi:hypothetical protein